MEQGLRRAAALLLAMPAAAQAPQRLAVAASLTRSVTVPECPRAARPDEIVVCARRGESPYRLPPQFRDVAPDENTRAGRTVAVERFDLLHNDHDGRGYGAQVGLHNGYADWFVLEHQRNYAQHPEWGRIGGGGPAPMPEPVVTASVEAPPPPDTKVAGPR